MHGADFNELKISLILVDDVNFIFSFLALKTNIVSCTTRELTAPSFYLKWVKYRGEFMPRQTRQLPRAVDLKGRLLSCQSY